VIAVAPSDISYHWKSVRPVLEKLQRVSDGWIAEDVYCFLMSGQATLYVNEGEWKGFAILQLVPNYSQKRLHCWVVQTTDDPKAYMEEVEAIARQTGAVKITFDSPRKGWAKRAQRLGFRPTMTRYEKEL
jgi:hypothetical protein